MMAAVLEVAPAPTKLPPSPPMSTSDRPDSCVSIDTVVTESVVGARGDSNSNNNSNNNNNHSSQEENEEGDESLVLAIRALRLLENPQAAAAEAIQAFDPKANLHPDLVRLLVAAAVRHPDVAQNLIELGQGHTGGHLVRRTPSGSLQPTLGDGAGRHASGLLHEISISSLLSSIDEGNSSRRALEAAAAGDAAGARPTLKRRLSVLSTKKASAEQQAANAPAGPPPRKEKISIESIKKICKANLKDTQESIEKLERAELDDEFIGVDELRRMAEECLGHETGKFALCLALTLRDAGQRWEATRYLMTAMADKLKLLLTIRGRFGPDGDVGLPGQDGFGVRDCWVVLSEAERERLALEDDGQWPRHLAEAARRAPKHAAKAWEILDACGKIQEAHAPSPRSSVDSGSEDGAGSAAEEGGDAPRTPKPVAKRHAMSAASPQEITDRWAFFFDLLDEEAARRCFRELRLLRQLFNAAQAPGGGSGSGSGNRANNLKSRAKRALSRPDEDLERWLDTKWAINAMKSFMMSKAGIYDADGSGVSFERLDQLDNAFCKTFWACLGSGDHKRLAKEDGKQWVTDIMRVFEHRRRYDVMFRLRDIMHFMQANM